MKSMAAPSTKKSISPHFTPIEECNEEEEELSSFRETTHASEHIEYKHYSTPLHNNSDKNKEKKSSKKLYENNVSTDVFYNKCRPGNKDKIVSVTPFEHNYFHRNSASSPNGVFKSIFGSMASKRSPKTSDGGSSVTREEHWRIVATDISNKLIQTARKRDEAVLEASKLKYSMTELEKKLNKLEIYCHSLKYGLEVCSAQKQQVKSPCRLNYQFIKVGNQEKVIEHFLVLVSDARSTVSILSRALSHQVRQMGGKVCDRISLLLQSYDVKISLSRNHKGLVFYLEALLNKAFFEEFETIGFDKDGRNPILNPIDRCESNFAMFSRLQGLTWEDVLSKGTRHFSEDFSKFCDKKMSEIVAMLGWNRAWSEPLLQAFFGASKAVWFVHLLANSVHPGLPIFRVNTGIGFDPVYMEDMGGDKVKKMVPAIVRIMVTPGFYVYDNVVKCKVLCRYYNNNQNGIGGHVNGFSDKASTLSPSR